MTHIYYPAYETTDFDLYRACTGKRIKELEARIEELEATCAAREKLVLALAGDKIDLVSELAGVKGKLEKALLWLHECMDEIDVYIWQEYPGDHPTRARHRKQAIATNPARIAIAELSGVSFANLKG